MSIKRTTAPQDDKREQEQLRIFGLRQDPDSSREDNDAILDLSGFESQRIELKTTTKTSLTTARDFGVSHIQNWRGKHILASFYDGSGREIRWSLLIPSHFLNRWLDSQLDYVKLDLRIIESVESIISEEFLNQLRNSVFPGQERYTLNELKKLLKNQISKEDLLAFLDNAQAYASPESMNRAVKERLRYLISRGGTRNNPHIGKEFMNTVVKEDCQLRFSHESGNYQAASGWLIKQLSRYAV